MSSVDRSDRTSPLPYILALLFVVAMVAVAWWGRDQYEPVIAGEPAPDFVASTFDGETRTLEDYEGRVILLNVWATWCAPCRWEMPSMQRLAEELEGTDFQVVAVSVDAASEGSVGWGGNVGGDVAGFVDEYGLTFEVLRDPSGRIADTYQTTGLPESFLIGRDGVIYKKVAGGTEWDAEQYVEQIQRLLGS